ncbi:MAG: hypothetical protein HRF40_01255 [Nitrososphaera sp.]|jgi:hypothetical protein
MKKAPIAIALVLVFGLFATAFSLAPAVAQNATMGTNATGTNATTTDTTTNATTTGTTTNATTTTDTTTNATGGETFSARGSIAALIFDTGETITTSEAENDTTTTTTTTGNETGVTGNMTAAGNDTTAMMPQVITGGEDNATASSSNMTGMDSNATASTTTEETTAAAEEISPPYVLSGDWNLDVQDGSVNEFAADFVMVHLDGTERHTHELSNFVSSNSTTIDISGEGSSFIFGTVDVATNGQPKWTGVDALIIIDRNNVISISLATEDTDDHFMGQPIYGIVESMTDENGNELIDTGAATVGNATGVAPEGNMTAGGNQTSGGNQTDDGGFLGNLSGGIQDLFNSTGQ